MFSFIKRFFENRRKKAAERDLLCRELLLRVTKLLTDYVDVDKSDKDALRKWLNDSEKLLAEQRDSVKYKKSSFYARLKQQWKTFDAFRIEAAEFIRAISIKEWQKRVDAEQVSRMLNQWTSEQKHQKIKVSKSKNLGKKIGKLSSLSVEPIPAEANCSCCGKDGKKKMLYSTETEALLVAEYRSKEAGYPLRVYPCPQGCGFHITSNLN
ncbi:MAG: hypothetical protein IKS96_01225 [Fibrobacter sp.]|nr:hypothetical protein [Fibrobacter sp.]